MSAQLRNEIEGPIVLNFMPLANQDFSFTLFRRELGEDQLKSIERRPVWTGRLPRNFDNSAEEYVVYEIAAIPTNGFLPVELRSLAFSNLAKIYVFNLLRVACASRLQESQFSVQMGFRRRVQFTLDEDDYGKKLVWLEPYFLKETSSIGFLIGFEFAKNPSRPFDREVQRRSLSLDSHYRENRDYYVDYLAYIQNFFDKYHRMIFPLRDSRQAFDITWPPASVIPARLSKRVYQFAGEGDGASQFFGVRTHGPLKAISGNPLLCFVYREEHKAFAYDLYYALVGKSYPENFPGMKRMFGMDIQGKNISGIAVESFDAKHVLGRVTDFRKQRESHSLLPVIVFPWSRLHSSPESDRAYYSIKHAFLKEGLATQFVSLEKLQNKEALKWATSNIGLAVFGKLGGIPWRLKPEHQDCLIIGIGQAHKSDSSGNIHRYYAYSVLTDSSGVYQKIKVLSEASDEKAYLNGLTSNLSSLISDYAPKYRTVAVHTTFALRRSEIEAIDMSLASFEKPGENSPLMVVLNFDYRSKFIGFALWNNSRVPFESTFATLSQNEFLVWFEGLQYGKTVVARRVGHPMYVRFSYRSRDLSAGLKRSFLQDAMNLSGANWRGFNAKSMPVSVYYAKLIAEYVGNFDRLGLEEIEIENLPPWFL